MVRTLAGDAAQRLLEAGRTGASSLDLSGLALTSNDIDELSRSIGSAEFEMLDLSRNRLQTLPYSFSAFRNLSDLRLTGNQFDALPKALEHLSELETIHLEENHLEDLPEWIGSFSRLTELKLGGNRLSTLPDDMGRLDSLRHLRLSENRFESWPEPLSALTQLDELYMGANRFKQIPQQIRRLQGLTGLSFQTNGLTDLPDWLGELNGLTELYLDGNRLEQLPPCIRSLTCLTMLGLSDNRLRVLPEWLSELSELAELYLGGNRLQYLPDNLTHLRRLTKLAVQDNRLKSLPESLIGLERLSTLFAGGNRFAEFPPSLRRLTGLSVLSLNDARLEVLPDWLGEMSQLTELQLGDNRLRDIPQTCKSLGGLETLVMNGNCLTDLPGWLPALARLSALDLRDNQLTSAPDVLRDLANLTSLDLADNRIEVLPSWIANLTQLTVLSLSGNRLTSLPASLRDLTGLTFLALDRNRISELPSWISSLLSLTDLYLDGNRLEQLPNELQGLTRLQRLDISSNRLRSVPRSLGDLACLSELYLNHNFLHRVPSVVRSLVNLRKLGLDGNRLTTIPAWFAELGQLTQLTLRNNLLTRVPQSIKGLTNLSIIDLNTNRLTSLPAWFGGLTNLTALHIAENRMGQVPDCIRDLTEIQILVLVDNQLTELPPWLSQLGRLTELWVADNRIGGLPDSLAELSNLQKLQAQNNQISRIPDDLGQCRSLTSLVLGSNELTGLPSSLAMLGEITELGLNNNRFSEIPPWLEASRELTALYLDGNLISEWSILGGLRQLRVLGMRANDLESMPPGLVNLTGLEELDLGSNGFNEVPTEIRMMKNLRVLSVDDNSLKALPPWFSELTEIETLNLASNQFERLPNEVYELVNLRSLDLSGAGISRIDEGIEQLQQLRTLDVSGNSLQLIPEGLSTLQGLQDLNISYNARPTVVPSHGLGIKQLPRHMARLRSLEVLSAFGSGIEFISDELWTIPNLTKVDISGNSLTAAPIFSQLMSGLRSLNMAQNDLETIDDSICHLASLTSLNLSENRVQAIPKSLFDLADLEDLDLSFNSVEVLPSEVAQLRHLATLDLEYNNLDSIPFDICRLSKLQALKLEHNKIQLLPREIGSLRKLAEVTVGANPLPPELLAAAGEGPTELLRFLRLIANEGRQLSEVKLVLVGEGGVGKSSLLASLRNEPWIADRTTTHGIQIKPVEVLNLPAPIILNGWDFGGQAIYRPTHQIFFTDPAVYLVVWKPREGPEIGLVSHWIDIIRQRAGNGVRVHIVATHGGPGERFAHLDEAHLRARFGDMIAGFHHVDSATGLNIDELKLQLGRTASALPHAVRWYPESWLRLRAALTAANNPSLTYNSYAAQAAAAGLTEVNARSLALNAHALGHWIFYGDEPALAQIVILKPDWLSVAIGFVLEDPVIISAHGLARHRRLGEIWDDPLRPEENRYPRELQQIFLRLMERFELTYRVPELEPGEPISLVAQLVPAGEPLLDTLWPPVTELDEAAQVCRIIYEGSDQTTLPDGLMFRLIVLFHRYSLGRRNVEASAHWQSGMVLEDRYGSRRAFLVEEGNGVTIRVRGAYPQTFLFHLMQEVREYINDFWRGLDTRVMVPCGNACGLGKPGAGLFDVEKLVRRRERGKLDFPCPVPDCDLDADIDSLLLGVEHGFGPNERESLSRSIESMLRDAITGGGEQLEQIRSSVEGLESLTRGYAARAEDQLARIIRGQEDEAISGPRLISLVPLPRSIANPSLHTERMRISLWCEHSKLPVYLLNEGRDGRDGVYTVDVPRDWWVKAAPLLRTTVFLLKTLLPFSMAMFGLQLPDSERERLMDELELAGEAVSAVPDVARGPTGGGEDLSIEAGDYITDSLETPVLAGGGLLRLLHDVLRRKDPSFADLRRVRDSQGRFLWVHRKFMDEYNPPLPPFPITVE